MQFTIITPSLNYGRFLADCLESVASQEGVSFEHLLFDAGSTDDSEKIAASYPHAVWTQEPDKGMSDAINKGFDQAKGDWVMWLNADDRLKPGALKEILSTLQNSTADLVYGDWDTIDTNGKLIRHLIAPKWSRFIHIHHHCYIGSTAAFYRKSTIIDQGFRLREDFLYVMDGEFYARLDDEGKTFEHISLNIADFRLHGENLSQRHRGNKTDLSTIISSELQYAESRAIRRKYGITLFNEPYLNGIIDGLLWIAAKCLKGVLKKFTR